MPKNEYAYIEALQSKLIQGHMDSPKKRNHCASCEKSLSWLSLTHDHVKHGDNYFCDTVCFEEWLDKCEA